MSFSVVTKSPPSKHSSDGARSDCQVRYAKVEDLSVVYTEFFTLTKYTQKL